VAASCLFFQLVGKMPPHTYWIKFLTSTCSYFLPPHDSVLGADGHEHGRVRGGQKWTPTVYFAEVFEMGIVNAGANGFSGAKDDNRILGDG
jgi:hypothetical protein